MVRESWSTQCRAGNSQPSRAMIQQASQDPFTRRMSSCRLICPKLKASLQEIRVLFKKERVFFLSYLEKRGERDEKVRTPTQHHPRRTQNTHSLFRTISLKETRSCPHQSPRLLRHLEIKKTASLTLFEITASLARKTNRVPTNLVGPWEPSPRVAS